MNRDDARIRELEANAKNQIFYLNSIQETIKNNCSEKLVLGQTVYISNLAAPDWVLGDQTMNDVVYQYTEKLKKYESLSNCPLETPFYDGSECIKCEEG